CTLPYFVGIAWIFKVRRVSATNLLQAVASPCRYCPEFISTIFRLVHQPSAGRVIQPADPPPCPNFGGSGPGFGSTAVRRRTLGSRHSPGIPSALECRLTRAGRTA